MFYVYVLRSQTRKLLYIGYTNDFDKRLRGHNEGRSHTTKKYRPWDLVYLESYRSQEDAKDRERKLKQFGKVYSQLKRRIKRSLEVA